MRKTDQALRYLIAALTALGLLGMAPAVSGKQPNILLVMADDIGWTDIGSFGSEIDMAVCQYVPIGTHYFWHILNGLLVYLVFRGLLLNLTTSERRINS